MSNLRIPADKKIDSSKLDAWIQMNMVQSAIHSPSPAFVYVKDIEAAISGKDIDPVELQSTVEANTVTGTDPAHGIPFIYLDDLLDGFRGGRLEPEDGIHAAATEFHRREQLRS